MIIQAIDDQNFYGLFAVLSFIGSALCIYVMQQTWHDGASQLDPTPIRWLRRITMALIALAMCWNPLYMATMNYKPWPSMVGLVAAIDLMLAIRAVTLYSQALGPTGTNLASTHQKHSSRQR
jgi:hypothetical protein